MPTGPSASASAWQGTPADIHAIEQDRLENEWRRKAIDRLLIVFYVINGAVLFIIVLFGVAQTFLAAAPHAITERTFISLIAASAAQLGALAGFVGRSLAKR